MKTYLLTLFALLSLASFAQSPKAFNYQAVARDGNGGLINNQNISVRITISDSTIGSNIVEYSELHLVSTNIFGLFTLKIGQPTSVVSGSFASIKWSDGTQYMKVEMDPAAGTAFKDMGTQQLLSVPYALTAGSQIGFSARLTNQFSITSQGTNTAPYNATDFNDGNGFNTNTGSFTAPEDGVYQFNAGVQIFSVCGTGYTQLYFNKNGTIVNSQDNGTNELQLFLGTTMKLVAGDVISVSVKNGCTGTMQFGANFTPGTYFSGHKVY